MASEFSSKANLVEQKQPRKSKNFQKYAHGKGLNKKFEKNDNKFKKYDRVHKKKRGPCFVCGKVGHNAARCKFRKEDPLHSKPQANLTKLEIIVDVV